uniref:Pro-secreted protein ORF2 n=1 Tax=Avihepevirus magniiecur TaxID=1678144 RepID=A0A4Y1PJ32_9VIRU|nr:capsid protein [Avian hepatitis E virus]
MSSRGLLLMLAMCCGVSRGSQTLPARDWRGQLRRDNSAQWSAQQRPEGAVGPAASTDVVTAAGTRTVPDVDHAGAVLVRQYNLVTSPLGSATLGSTNAELYAAPVSPLMPLQDGTTSNIMSTESSNYAQYRVRGLTVRWRPVVPNAVGPFSITMAYWPQTTSTATSIDMNSIKSTDVRVVLQPGTACLLTIPPERLDYKNNGWRSVETVSVPQEDATSGMLMVCVHGTPWNSYTNTVYTAPLGMVDFAIELQLRNLSPGNTYASVARVKVTSPHTIKADPTGATITTTAAARFMADVRWGLGTADDGEIGHGILGVLFNLADTVLGGLPSALLAASGQYMYGRPVGNANGEPDVKLYMSVEDAVNDKPIMVPHDIDLGTSPVTCQDYGNQHVDDRPSPAPAPNRAFGTLRSGDVLRITGSMQYVTKAELLPHSVSQGYFGGGDTMIVHNVIIGVRGPANSVERTKATVDGVAVKTVDARSGSNSFSALPAFGKPAVWEPQGAGYFYQYNNTHQEWIYFLQNCSSVVWWASTNMLGQKSDTSILLEVRPIQASDQPWFPAHHTGGEGCTTCLPLGLRTCCRQAPEDQSPETRRLLNRLSKTFPSPP